MGDCIDAMALAALSFAAACHGGPTAATDASAAAVDVLPPDPHAARPEVELTWRLFETVRWLDGRGEEHQSSIFELMIEGGQPARVDLGRRESSGCVVKDGADGPSYLARLECRSGAHGAHGEYAEVTRPRPDELRIEAFGKDEAAAGPEAPRANVQVTIARIPVESDITVVRELARIPDDAPPRPKAPSVPSGKDVRR
jgi:hypothetical protein